MAKRNGERFSEHFVDVEGRISLDLAGSKCWACGQQIPENSEDRCDSCGALNRTKTDIDPPAVVDAVMAVISQPTIRRIWSFVMVMFVMGVIQVITFFGVKYIYLNFLPEAGELSFYLHWLLCFCLWVNTTLNYAEAVLRDPGFVQWNLSTVGRTLEGYTFCNKCQQGKPPGSHHCSICRRCVQNMDHHCPFIGNCVGRSNRRAFVLFLFWSASSLAYVLTITVIHCFDRSEDIARNVRQATEFLPQLKLETLPFYLNRLINHTYTGVHLQAVAFLLLLGSVTFLMTFSLLIQQARLISEGQTTISRLQAQRLARQKHRMGLKENQTETVQGKSTSCLQNWEDVFGRPWWSFLLPRIPLSRNPSGAAKTV